MNDYRHPATEFVDGTQRVKPNHYATAHVMDGPMLVGTIEYDSPGWVATVLATGETEWFPRKEAARTWIKDQRTEMTLADKLEQDLNVRFQWHGYDND